MPNQTSKDSEASPPAPSPARLVWLAWLPLPIFIVVIAALWVADIQFSFESIQLLTACNLLFSTLSSLYIAFLMGRSFLSNPSHRMLLLGAGVLIWGVGSFVAPFAGDADANITFTIHNLCVWTAACFHFAAVALPPPPTPPVRKRAWLCALYTSALGLVLLATLAAKSGLTPLFFVQGVGGTITRQFTLISTISLLTITAVLLLPPKGFTFSRVSFWYAVGLLLLACGLAGVMLQSQGGSLLSWAGRAAQYLGGIYLVLAAHAIASNEHPKILYCQTLPTGTRQRHLVAVAIVFTAMAVRMLFLEDLATTLPYLTFYPAVIIAALYGGLNSGLMATALSGILAHFFILEPAGINIRRPDQMVAMAFFLLSCGMISGVTEAMRRARMRAQEAETQARLAEEREKAQQAIRESEERFRTLADSSFEGIAITEDGRLTDVNEQLAEMFGYETAELIGMDVSALIMPEDSGRVVDRILRGVPSQIEHGAIRKDGKTLIVEAHGRNTTYRGRSVRITSIRDITERKKLERKLQSERDLLHTVMNGTKNSHLVYLDNNFNFVQVNETYARTCGYRPEDMIGKNHFELYPNKEVEAIFTRVRDTGEPFEVHDRPFEFPDQPARGVTYWDWTLHPVKDSSSAVIGIVFSLFETTQRKKAEDEISRLNRDLHQKLAELQTIFDTVPIGIAITDVQGGNIMSNHAFANIWRKPMPAAQSVSDYSAFKAYWANTNRPVMPGEWASACAVLNAETVIGQLMKVERFDGTSGFIHNSAAPILDDAGHVVGSVVATMDITERMEAENALRKARNELESKVAERTRELEKAVEELQQEITERKKLEQQLLQSQKMESIGILAGGVAHDFNNLLSAIYGYAEILHEQIPRDDEQLLECVENILNAATRAAELTKSLLTFSRKQPNDPKPVFVNDIIANTSRLIKRIIGEDIEFITEYYGKELSVMADTGQIAQMLMNLATNSRDAMPGGGRLTISVRKTFVAECSLPFLDLQSSGEYAQISVADTGSGIEEESIDRIFEPFFTTKEPGKGTGLGLSIVYRIAKQHSGSVVIKSEKGFGTTVTIFLPLIVSEATIEEEKPLFPHVRGSETLLVVEDEEIVRMLLARILGNAGFRVIEAGNGEEALDKFKEHDDISLVLTDVVMPKLNGREILAEIRKQKPDMKGIFISGYTADVINSNGILEKGIEFITKPIKKGELLKKIREALDNC